MAFDKDHPPTDRPGDLPGRAQLVLGGLWPGCFRHDVAGRVAMTPRMTSDLGLRPCCCSSTAPRMFSSEGRLERPRPAAPEPVPALVRCLDPWRVGVLVLAHQPRRGRARRLPPCMARP